MPSDGHLFLLSLITFGVGLIFFLAGFVLFLIHRRHAPVVRLTQEAPAVQTGLVPSPVVQNAPPSPLTLIRFKQALEGDGLNEAVLEFGRETLNLGLLGRGANFAIRSIEAGKRIGGMDIILRFGGRGLQLAQEGEVTIPIHGAAGRWLPELQGRSGRFVEIASGSGEVLGTLANVSALVVSLAYMVVSRETLGRLRSIETSIEGLLRGRHNDRIAKLERIYVKSGELLRTLPYGARNHLLDTFQNELYEIRAEWRREIDRILSVAPDPSGRRAWARWLSKVARAAPFIGGLVEWSHLRSRRPKERLLFEHLLPIVDIVRCLRLSLLVDVSIAQWTESVDLLFQHTLQNEAEMWEGIADRLESQVRHFRTAKAPDYLAVIAPAIEAIRSYTDALNGTLPKDTVFRPQPVRTPRRTRGTRAVVAAND
ncbi:MAG: hypothetical protein ABSE51_22955 [Terracidiphilus sp.]|jgi:hypothetical protein